MFSMNHDSFLGVDEMLINPIVSNLDGEHSIDILGQLKTQIHIKDTQLKSNCANGRPASSSTGNLFAIVA